jgi:hypothetical protein
VNKPRPVSHDEFSPLLRFRHFPPFYFELVGRKKVGRFAFRNYNAAELKLIFIFSESETGRLKGVWGKKRRGKEKG